MPRRYKHTERGLASRAARSNETRAALLEAARTLFSENGYDQVSVTEIGKAAGVSPSLINTYFDGKAGLLYALFEASNEAVEGRTHAIAAGEGDAPDLVYAMLLAWAETDLADPRIYHLIMGYLWGWSDEYEIRNRPERARFTNALVVVVQKGQVEGKIGSSAAPQVVAEAIVAVYFWAMREAVFRKRGPVEAIDSFWPHIAALLAISPERSRA